MKIRLLPALLLVIAPVVSAQTPRAIPGITAKDAFPGACVDCHQKDRRVTALLAQWNGKVDAKKLATMQGFVPQGLTLKGKHPTVPGKDVPASCLKCHATTSKTIPPLPALMHGIHFSKGANSEFVKQFGGECTHCHKFDSAKARWSMPSGAEK